MGTKNNPAPFDCYANAEPDEPMFVLLARDASAPSLVREWVRQRRRRKGLTTHDEKALEAIACAEAMERWRIEQRLEGQQDTTERTWRHADGGVRVDHMDAREGDYFGGPDGTR